MPQHLMTEVVLSRCHKQQYIRAVAFTLLGNVEELPSCCGKARGI
ncbi:hypothetical protein [Cereibacter sphaeroides]|nr:hypothetical protein [Cereibacter sphaeroides]ACM00205.1 Hypothetical Protein RSKD131_0345 [Cereibacter sphaeroides KD131]